MKQIIFIVILMVISSVIVKAQSNGRVEFQELGLSFKVPSGWSGGVKDELYLLGHSSIPGLMVLSQNTSKSATELKNLALQGIQEEGIQLSPKGDFTLKGNDQVEGFYEGTFNGSNVRVFSIGLINKMGSGMNISIVTEKAKFSDIHIQEARKLAKSVKFFQQKDSKETAFWKQRIVSKRLRYMKVRTSNNANDGSFTGTSDSVSITLYNDGTFYYDYSATASMGGGAVSGLIADQDKNKGEFKIYTADEHTYLDLYFPNKTRTYELTVNNKRHTLLSGTRYLILPLE